MPKDGTQCFRRLTGMHKAKRYRSFHPVYFQCVAFCALEETKSSKEISHSAVYKYFLKYCNENFPFL